MPPPSRQDAKGSLGRTAAASRGAGRVELDVLVVGSGVAGLSAAVRLAGGEGVPGGAARAATRDTGGLRVGILTKAELSQSATRWAQGGIAAVLGGDEDSLDLHLADTLAAGAGLCDVDAVRILVGEGPERVNELIATGAVFDRSAEGALERAREGGHSTARVLHAGGAATGAEVERALVSAVRATAALVLEGWFALDLLVDGGRCVGVVALDPEGRRRDVTSRHVVLATGGAGQLYAVTTNPAEATGDGIAMALRAGVPVADIEFMQFHPTALHHPAMPRPLLSEALRGHGALLRDASGERFVDELAPRDVVSRAMAARMAEESVDHLWLDATSLDHFDERFPTIASSLAAAGLEPGAEWLPIAPAAHYLSGGVVTDLDGATALPGLWAAGEVACTGVHGANRLASNSLLEGMVFAARVAEALAAGKDAPEPTGVMRALLEHGDDIPCSGIDELASEAGLRGVDEAASEAGLRGADGGTAWDSAPDMAKLRLSLERAMTEGAGVLRSALSLAEVAGEVDFVGESLAELPDDRERGELENLVELARAAVRAAALREETRGAHARVDFPETSSEWRRRIVHGSRALPA